MGYTYEQLVKMGATPGEPKAPSGSAPASTVSAGAPKKYTYDELVKAGATPGDVSRETPKEPGTFQKIVQGIASPVLKGASNIVALANAGDDEKYNKIQKEGVDYGYFGKHKPIGATLDEEGKKTSFGTRLKDTIGTGLEAASYAVGGGEAIPLAKVGLKEGLKMGVKQGVKEGVAIGATGGMGQGMQDPNAGVGDVIGKTALGGLLGGATGGVLGGATGAVKSALGKVADNVATKAEVVANIENKVPDASIASKTINEAGKVVKDKAGAEAVRQGIPEAEVAYIKTASDTNKAKMSKMLDIRQKSLTNKRSIERSSDVVGDTFLQHAKFIESKNRQAGKDLNVVASRLRGKKIDPTVPLTEFGNELENAGIGIRGKTLNFKGSDFEGIGPSQTAIRNVYERALRVAKTGDALEAHRLKKYIDEIVDYGKNAEGLSGRAQRMLKGLRRNMDTVLDSKFPLYNKFNTIFSDTIGEMNKIGDALGHSFRIGDTFANAKVGTAMRSILSNSQKRAQILQLLESMQGVSKKYGLKTDDDIVTQALFADTLEKMLGSEAPSSFLGQVETGVGQAISAGTDIARGNVIGGTIKAGKFLIDATRGVNQEAKINALKALLQSAPKKTSVFGKKVSPTMGEIAPVSSMGKEIVDTSTKPVGVPVVTKPQKGPIAKQPNESHRDWTSRIIKEHDIGNVKGVDPKNITQMRIFGSAVEGKKNPRDIDVFVTVKDGSMKFKKSGGLPKPEIIKHGKVQYFVMPESDADSLLEAMLYTGIKDADRGYSGSTVSIPKTVFGKKR